MSDPDLEIKGGGGGAPKILFLSAGPQFGVKKYEGGRGGGRKGHPGPSPGSATVI